MVNWQDPTVIVQEYASVAVVSQVSGGIFLWEWITTLYFDWKLLSAGRLEFRSPTILYILSRLTALATVICLFYYLNIKSEISFCDAMSRAIVDLGYSAIVLSSALMALRVVAIWNRDRRVILFAAVVIILDAVFLLHGLITDGGATWDPTARACIAFNTARYKLNIVVTFITDILMLVVMLIGIWFQRGSGSLWRVVERQGIIWLIIAIISYAPLVVLIFLNFNNPMNLMLQLPFCLSM
ncbi:hypothetical protein A0H81_02915 [Grifola frondosa]|uniref:Uncharacterized protein n=1 Tax=Grifola frondosa TaxID=5627 RepID=A0A1C7MIX2_GRIFR|nr:hypothetical protein A0H81_02915 [Grifola frondosa]